MLTLIDWKSSAFISPEMLMQLGAYYGATHYRENDGELLGWQERTPATTAQQGAIIKIGPDYVGLAKREIWGEIQLADGTTKRGKVGEELMRLSQADLEAGFAQFRNALDIFWWLVKKQHVQLPKKEAYQFHDKQLVSVTYVLQHVIAKPMLLNWYAKMAKEGKDPEQERDRRGAEGSLWHKNILFFLQGRPVDLSQAPESLKQTLTQFAYWQQKVKLDPVALETKVAHPALGYAGTYDCLARCTLGEAPAAPEALGGVLKGVGSTTTPEGVHG